MSNRSQKLSEEQKKIQRAENEKLHNETVALIHGSGVDQSTRQYLIYLLTYAYESGELTHHERVKDLAAKGPEKLVNYARAASDAVDSLSKGEQGLRGSLESALTDGRLSINSAANFVAKVWIGKLALMQVTSGIIAGGVLASPFGIGALALGALYFLGKGAKAVYSKHVNNQEAKQKIASQALASADSKTAELPTTRTSPSVAPAA